MSGGGEPVLHPDAPCGPGPHMCAHAVLLLPAQIVSLRACRFPVNADTGTIENSVSLFGALAAPLVQRGSYSEDDYVRVILWALTGARVVLSYMTCTTRPR